MKKEIYYYKGNPYTIFSETKMRISGVWKDCVIYSTLYVNEDGQYWVRPKEEFFKFFKTKEQIESEAENSSKLWWWRT